MEQLALICLFLRKNHPLVEGWTDRQLVEWVQWFLASRQLVCVYDKDRAIVGVGAARCLSDGLSDEDHYVHDELGDIVHVDLAVGTGVMPVLWKAMKERFGKRKWLSFRRDAKVNNRRRLYDLAAFERHLYGKQSATSA